MIDYKSPIEIWHSEMEMQLEGEVLKACQRVGVNVDRDELLKALKYDRGQFDKGYQYGLNADKWIPCSERLPKDGQCVLVQLNFSEHDLVDYEYDSAIQVRRYDEKKENEYKWKSIEWDSWLSEEVISAWQPLPTQYKKEGAE